MDRDSDGGLRDRDPTGPRGSDASARFRGEPGTAVLRPEAPPMRRLRGLSPWRGGGPRCGRRGGRAPPSHKECAPGTEPRPPKVRPPPVSARIGPGPAAAHTPSRRFKFEPGRLEGKSAPGAFLPDAAARGADFSAARASRSRRALAPRLSGPRRARGYLAGSLAWEPGELPRNLRALTGS